MVRCLPEISGWKVPGRGAVALVVALWGCGVSSTGLGPTPDGSAGGSGAYCPAGLIELASWPVKTTATSCSRPCGPDAIGMQTCSQVGLSQCQKESGCLCLEGPCVSCASCAFQSVADCYVPTNVAAATACATGVEQGGACGPACGRRLCLQSDGKTACVCNSGGKYACAEWSGSGWQ
jgi:hypothetical protein